MAEGARQWTATKFEVNLSGPGSDWFGLFAHGLQEAATHHPVVQCHPPSCIPGRTRHRIGDCRIGQHQEEHQCDLQLDRHRCHRQRRFSERGHRRSGSGQLQRQERSERRQEGQRRPEARRRRAENCAANFSVKEFEPPTVSCSASPQHHQSPATTAALQRPA